MIYTRRTCNNPDRSARTSNSQRVDRLLQTAHLLHRAVATLLSWKTRRTMICTLNDDLLPLSRPIFCSLLVFRILFSSSQYAMIETSCIFCKLKNHSSICSTSKFFVDSLVSHATGTYEKVCPLRCRRYSTELDQSHCSQHPIVIPS